MYAKTNSAGFVKRLADGMVVPEVMPGCADTDAYAAWLAAGNVPALPSDWRLPVEAEYKVLRENYLNRLTGLAARATRRADTTGLAAAADGMAQGLLDMLTHATVTAASDPAGMRLAIKQRYVALVTAAKLASPLSKAEFDKVGK